MFGFANPWLLLGMLGAMVATFLGGYIKGDADAAHRYQVKITTMQIEAKDAAQKSRQAMLDQADAAISTLETGNAKARVVYRTIRETVDKLVDRPVYLQSCFDDDGLRLVNAALGNIPVAPPDPGNPDNRMPTIDPAR